MTLPYTDFSFDKLKINLTNQLSKIATWTDKFQSSTGIVLITIFSYVGDLINYNIERNVEESYLDTAKRESSVKRNVKLLNYRPFRRVSASCTLRFTVPVAPTTAIVIPKGTEITDAASEYKFVTIEDGRIGIGKTYVDITAKEGEMFEVDFGSSGFPNQSFMLENKNIENYGVQVNIKYATYQTTWKEIYSLVPYAYAKSDYFETYEIRELPNNFLRIVFGDGTYGKIPEKDNTINIQYLVSSGVSGNISQTGKLVEILSTIKDENGTIITDITVSNITPATGGTERESINEIKRNAPLIFQSTNKAVSKTDNYAIIYKDPSVAKAYVECERDVYPPNYDMFNRVNLYILRKLDNDGVPQEITTQWLYGDSEYATEFNPDKGSFLSTMYESGMITVKYYVFPGEIVKVDTFVTCYAPYGSNLEVIKSNMDIVMSTIMNFENRGMGEDVVLSKINSFANSVPGVSYAIVDFKVLVDLPSTGAAVVDFELPVRPVALGRFELYVGGDLVAIDDGAGALEQYSLYDGNYTLSAGTIDYENGIVSFSLTQYPPTTTPIIGRFKQGSKITKQWNNAVEKLEKYFLHIFRDTPIISGTLLFKIDGVNVLRDDGAGLIEQYPGYTGIYTLDLGETHSINYDTGKMEFTLEETLGDKVICQATYTQNKENSDLDVEKDQVAILGSNTNTAIYLK